MNLSKTFKNKEIRIYRKQELQDLRCAIKDGDSEFITLYYPWLKDYLFRHKNALGIVKIENYRIGGYWDCTIEGRTYIQLKNGRIIKIRGVIE